MVPEGTGTRCARDLGQGWNISPFIEIARGERRALAAIGGPGAIQQIWCVVSNIPWRDVILRIHWDGQERPSVECPLGDFFACSLDRFAQVTSLAVRVNPGRAFNCYWEMPFREHARVTLENRNLEAVILYYQINYALTEVPTDAAYFHAQFCRADPLPDKEDHTILDGVEGQGRYVGTYMARVLNNAGWWGEITFFMDGDRDWPTICGTGTEDHFCGACNFDGGVIDPNMEMAYREFTTPYAGLPQVLRPTSHIRARPASGCIAGTSPMRSAPRPISG